MLLPRLLAPGSRASQGEGNTMPGDGDAVFELGAVLWMNPGTKFNRTRNPVGRRHRGELVGVRSLKNIGAEQHPAAIAIEAAARVGDLPDRQVGVADAAVDRGGLLPEAAGECQAEFDGGRR